MNCKKHRIAPYIAGAAAAAGAAGLSWLGIEAADTYFQLAHGIEPPSLGELYRLLPTWMKIAAPANTFAALGVASVTGYNAYKQLSEPEQLSFLF